MQTVFILIMLAHAGLSTSSGNSLAVAEFYSKENCEKAGQAIKQKSIDEPKLAKLITFVCTEK